VRISRQWTIVGIVVLTLIAGAFALVRSAPRARAELGGKAPDYRAVDLATGDTVSLRERYAGHVTLVNIWATWCIPCRTEMPSMQQAYAALKNRGFRIAAVSIDETGPEGVQQFAREMGLTFDILHDRSGGIQTLYGTTGVPESFLLDKHGNIMKRDIGAHDWSSPANRKLIERYLSE
jgi:cytochrome c biogenesis protein CcmG, thiol:disulfide interchange protein DsbE